MEYTFGHILLMMLPVLVFAGTLIAVIVTFGRSVFRYFYDNAQPVRIAQAKVLSKREELRRSMQSDIVEVIHPFKSYFVMFELENGNQFELLIPPNQVGRIEEGKVGQLYYQGSRFKGFMG